MPKAQGFWAARKQASRRMAALYEGGWSTRQIADEYGITYCSVWRRLQRVGVQCRSLAEAQQLRRAAEAQAQL